ncbi:MAG: hypothetical protein ABJC04_09930, partial [Verrucomicrobiota bacterium]
AFRRMKTRFNPPDRSGMSRVELLAVICVALFAIYLVVRFQTAGDELQITGRKTRMKKPENRPLPETQIYRPIPHAEVAPTATNRLMARTNLVSANPAKSKTNESGPFAGNTGKRVDDRRKQLVQIPANSAWYPHTSRKGPGVRIAFP